MEEKEVEKQCEAAVKRCPNNDLRIFFISLLAAIIVWNRYHAAALRRFGGITGDTSGYFVQCLELAMMAGMYAGQCVEISGFILWRSF